MRRFARFLRTMGVFGGLAVGVQALAAAPVDARAGECCFCWENGICWNCRPCG